MQKSKCSNFLKSYSKASRGFNLHHKSVPTKDWMEEVCIPLPRRKGCEECGVKKFLAMPLMEGWGWVGND